MKLTRIIILVLIANILGLGSLFVLYNINPKNSAINTDDGIVIVDEEVSKYTEPESEIIAFENSFIEFGSQANHPFIKVTNGDKVISFVDEEIQGEIIDIVDKEYFITAIILQDGVEIEIDYFISINDIIPFHKKQLDINYTKGVVIKPEYLVIHETANRNIGADANAHYRYWSTNSSANASTHFVVDSKEIYQMLDLENMAWHVGDNRGYSNIYNTNAIGIEIAVNADGDYMKAREYTIAFTALLMRNLDMDIKQLKRHFDASGKDCPYYMLEDPALWTDFVDKVEKLL